MLKGALSIQRVSDLNLAAKKRESVTSGRKVV